MRPTDPTVKAAVTRGVLASLGRMTGPPKLSSRYLRDEQSAAELRVDKLAAVRRQGVGICDRASRQGAGACARRQVDRQEVDCRYLRARGECVVGVEDYLGIARRVRVDGIAGESDKGARADRGRLQRSKSHERGAIGRHR